MLSDDVTSLGYTLLCVATPTSDCQVDIISEVSHSPLLPRGAAWRACRVTCTQVSPASCLLRAAACCIPTAVWRVRRQRVHALFLKARSVVFLLWFVAVCCCDTYACPGVLLLRACSCRTSCWTCSCAAAHRLDLQRRNSASTAAAGAAPNVCIRPTALDCTSDGRPCAPQRCL